MDGRRIGEHQLIEFAKAIGYFSAVEIGVELAFLHVDPRHDAEIAVVDVLFVIVLDLHDLVARAERPTEAVDADLASRVQGVLQLDVEGASAEPAAVHWAENLDIAYRIQPETFRDPLLHDCQHLSNTLFRARGDNVCENLAWPDRRKLIDIADEQQRGSVRQSAQ